MIKNEKFRWGIFKKVMTTVESILLFSIAALLLVTAAIHGFVLVMTHLDKRADERRRNAGELNTEYRSD